MAALEHTTIDPPVVNLYPFSFTVAVAGNNGHDAIENIEIAWPPLRGAAKN